MKRLIFLSLLFSTQLFSALDTKWINELNTQKISKFTLFYDYLFSSPSYYKDNILDLEADIYLMLTAESIEHIIAVANKGLGLIPTGDFASLRMVDRYLVDRFFLITACAELEFFITHVLLPFKRLALKLKREIATYLTPSESVALTLRLSYIIEKLEAIAHSVTSLLPALEKSPLYRAQLELLAQEKEAKEEDYRKSLTLRAEEERVRLLQSEANRMQGEAKKAEELAGLLNQLKYKQGIDNIDEIKKLIVSTLPQNNASRSHDRA